MFSGSTQSISAGQGEEISPSADFGPVAVAEGDANAHIEVPPRDETAMSRQSEPHSARRMPLSRKAESQHAHNVVRELYLRYLRQQERYRGYRNLFVFLGFMALFMAILFTQRQANAAFQVHKSLSDVLVPEEEVMGSVGQVHEWLRDALEEVWVDPVCGDGICERPYEFPEYGRFGCRADCGLLKDEEQGYNLTMIRISISHNFNHPAGSIPAAELMQQASWNLCPVADEEGAPQVAFSRGCYYEEDNTFDSLDGNFVSILDDVPDGRWNLIVRRDVFRKTRGTIMDYSKVLAVAYYYRVYVAAVTVMAEQNTEVGMLEHAKQFIGSPGDNRSSIIPGSHNRMEGYTAEFFPWLKLKLNSGDLFGGDEIANPERFDYYLQSFVNATCGCWAVPVDPEDPENTDTFGEIVGNATGLPLMLEPFALGFNPISNRQELEERICTPEGAPMDDDMVLYEAVDGPWEKVGEEWRPAGNPAFQSREEVLPSNRSRVCQAMYEFGVSRRREHTDIVRRLIVNQRLGDQRTTGKIAARNVLRDSLRAGVQAQQLELFDPIFRTATGTSVLDESGNPSKDDNGNPHMPRARLSVLAQQFLRGKRATAGPAGLQLTRRVIYGEDGSQLVAIPDMLDRIDARIKEVKESQREMLDIDVPRETPPRSRTVYPETIKVHDLIEGFARALALDIDGPRCEKQGESEFKPCLVLDMGEGRDAVVISNNTMPRANDRVLGTIGTTAAEGEPAASGPLDGSALSAQSSSSSAAAAKPFSIRNADAGTDTLNIVTNFYDTKAAEVEERGLRTGYLLKAWDGGRSAYLELDLTRRGPWYLGQCTLGQNDVSRNLVCSRPAETPATAAEYLSPWECENDQGKVQGDLTDLNYRLQCEMPCERRSDCNTLCHCENDCVDELGRGAYCECAACTSDPLDPAWRLPAGFTLRRLNYDATQDEQFGTLVSGDALADANIPRFDEDDGSVNRRALQNVDTSELLREIQRIRRQQSDITRDMSALTSQVDLSNQLASQRADDNPVLAVIREIRQSINSGQSRVESRLDEILGRQTRSLEVAQRSTAALNAIEGLAQRQIDAQEALQSTLTNQLGAIRQRIERDEIAPQEALFRYKGTRLEDARNRRRSFLSTRTVNTLNTMNMKFDLDNGNRMTPEEPRKRFVGLTNRVIAGLLVHQVRTKDEPCSESKFFKIQDTCAGPITTEPYGIDPVFKPGTELFNPDFQVTDNSQLKRFYNCTDLGKEDWCSELFNDRQTPYAFKHFQLEDEDPGFPVFFDINLSEQDAQRWATYLREGLYIDQNTREVEVHLMTYNAPLRVFAYLEVEFEFSEGGSIEVEHRLDAVLVELYCTRADDARYAFEIILSIWVYVLMLKNLLKILRTQRKEGNFLKFFLRGWNWTEFISNALLTTCVSLWWYFVINHQRTFDLELRHENVYENGLVPQANFLKLANDGEDFKELWDDFEGLADLIETLDLYFALGGINILLLMVRMLKLMDFQPRLGVVTRSLWLAGPDLIHFAFVFFMVFVGYAMLAHLIFGNAIEDFQTFDDSVNTCFNILLGEIDVNEELRELGGLQAIAGAFFFWTYMLLVFMVLLNFLLAIIVDAFSEVKEQTHETVGIHTELYQLGREKLHSMMSLIRPNYIADTKVEQMLKQWALGDDANKQRDDKPEVSLKLLTVMNEDLDEKDLELVLKECLKEAPQDLEEEPKKLSFGKRLLRCLPGQRKMRANEEQVEMAAKFIIDRFGIPTVVEEEDEEEDNGGDLRSVIRAMRQRANQEAEDQREAEEREEQARLAGAGAAVATQARGPEYERLVRERDEALRRAEQLTLEQGGAGGSGAAETALEAAERDQLAAALDRLGGVQRLLADSQATLLADQQRLAQLVAQLNEERGRG